jgi:hypothetical protein
LFYALKEIDSILGIQFDNRLFPVLGIAIAKTTPSRFTFTVLRPHLKNLDIKQFFDRHANVIFCGQPIDFKGIGVESRASVHTLFGHQWPEQNLMGFKLNLRLARLLLGRFALFCFFCRHLIKLLSIEDLKKHGCNNLLSPRSDSPYRQLPASPLDRSFIQSSAARVTTIFFGLRTLKALRSLTGETETSAIFRALL